MMIRIQFLGSYVKGYIHSYIITMIINNIVICFHKVCVCSFYSFNLASVLHPVPKYGKSYS